MRMTQHMGLAMALAAAGRISVERDVASTRQPEPPAPADPINARRGYVTSREELIARRKARPNVRWSYAPHQGARECARRIARA